MLGKKKGIESQFPYSLKTKKMREEDKKEQTDRVIHSVKTNWIRQIGNALLKIVTRLIGKVGR
jgi:hypothetical protein